MSHEIRSAPTQRVEAVIRIVDEDEFEFTDVLRATWESPSASTFGTEGYWLVCGDNTGSQQLVVYPHMLEPLRDLLGHLQEIGEDAE